MPPPLHSGPVSDNAERNQTFLIAPAEPQHLP